MVLLWPIIATSLSPSLSKSPHETELLDNPLNGSSFWVSVIELSKSVIVVSSVIELTTFETEVPGVTIMVSSSSSTLSSIPVIDKTPVVEPDSIKISGLIVNFDILWRL